MTTSRCTALVARCFPPSAYLCGTSAYLCGSHQVHTYVVPTKCIPMWFPQGHTHVNFLEHTSHTTSLTACEACTTLSLSHLSRPCLYVILQPRTYPCGSHQVHTYVVPTKCIPMWFPPPPKDIPMWFPPRTYLCGSHQGHTYAVLKRQIHASRICV